MTSNAVVPGLTGTLPASLSRAATTTVLRQQYGYDGVVFTDSLSAAAISAAGYDVPRAAVAALVAGADDVLFGTTTTTAGGSTADAVRAAIVAAVDDGKLPAGRLRDAAAHVAEGLGRTVCPA